MRISCIFSFLSFLDTLFLYMRYCDHLQIYIVLIFSTILLMYVFFFTCPFICCFFSPFIHVSYICMQSIIYVSHKDALMSFV